MHGQVFTTQGRFLQKECSGGSLVMGDAFKFGLINDFPIGFHSFTERTLLWNTIIHTISNLIMLGHIG